MSGFKDLYALNQNLQRRGYTMPVLFVGHGSPMNGIQENEFSTTWRSLGRRLPKPSAVLIISAHWYTPGTFVTAMEAPPTIHDFYGFPKALHEVQYDAPGSPALAAETAQLIKSTETQLSHEWGLDHGAWSVVMNMYPDADVPMIQMSIDYTQSPQWHYDLAKELSALRNKGVLILGSGNMIHNLRIMDWQLSNQGYDWADELNTIFKKHIAAGSHQYLINYETLGKAASMAIPTPEHYLPMLYAVGLQDKADDVSFFNDKTVMGSVSMTSFAIGKSDFLQ